MRTPDAPGSATVPGLFAHACADPARPLLTWYDDRTGERSELSGATMGNWVAKTGNLLIDGCGLGLGDRAAVLLPPHWQTAAVLLGVWSAGLSVHGADHPAEVLFTDAPRAAALDRSGGPGGTVAGSGGWDTGAAANGADGPAVAPLAAVAAERFALALAPLAAPLRQAPPGFADYVVEVRAHGDQFAPYAPVSPEDLAGSAAGTGDPLTHAELCAAAADRAAALGVPPRARVLIDVDRHSDPLDWLLAPLAVGASTVLCASLDRDRLAARVESERATVTLA